MIPAMFIAHGSPMVAIEDSDYGTFLDGLSSQIQKPRAIVIFSAHWESTVQKVSEVAEYDTIYDFGGFPDELYQVKYPARGDITLSKRIEGLFDAHGIQWEAETKRGLDHGAWTILHRLYPNVDIPVVAMSVNANLPPEEQYRIGQALAELTEDDVLVIGSGVTVHNFQIIRLHNNAEVQQAVQSFETWLEDKLKVWDTASLFAYRTEAPHADVAVPRNGSEHFVPLFYAMGAADGRASSSPEDGMQSEQKPRVETLHRSWLWNVMTNTVFRFGPCNA